MLFRVRLPLALRMKQKNFRIGDTTKNWDFFLTVAFKILNFLHYFTI